MHAGPRAPASHTWRWDSHLPAAINISLKELDADTATRLDRSRPVIAYCFDYQ